MIHLTDGRPDLYQWDTGRKLTFDGECQQMHFSNKAYGRSIDVDCQQEDGHSTAAIPDRLLQTATDLSVYAYVGTERDGYTRVEKVFHVQKRPRPADYVFTPTDQTTLQSIVDSIGDLAGLDTTCKDNLVCAINEAAKSGNVYPEAIAKAVEAYFQSNPIKYPVESVNGQTGAVNLTAADIGALTQAALQDGIDTALEQAKASGEFDGPPGFSPTARVNQTPDGATITITDQSGTTTATVKNGKDGAPAVVDPELSPDSENPVQNKAVNAAVAALNESLADKLTAPAPTEKDEGKFLRVSGGAAVWQTVPDAKGVSF